MTRAIYFDCFAGASGDMIVGALLDLGLDFDVLKDKLASLGLPGYELSATRVRRSGVAATKFNVEVLALQPPNRGLKQITDLIADSKISERGKSIARSIFNRLAEAEARVHGCSIEDVHFHEVGAVDSIIDITAAAIGFDLLGIERFFASALRVGFGTVRCAHGLLPVPGPATADLLIGAPVFAGEVEGEFVTPTGAAILSTLCSFGSMPRLTIERVGYGAGTRDPEGLPNVIRAITGNSEDQSALLSADQPVAADETIVVIETNIDDMNPQVYGYVFQRAFQLGALDAFTSPIQMKKDRPATMLTVLSPVDRVGLLTDLLVAETTTLGVRYYEAARRVLARETITVDTAYGPIRVKVARLGSRTLHFQPEFDDCARLAQITGAPLLDVQNAASAEYRDKRLVEQKESETSQD